jgi:hypothetical protein
MIQETRVSGEITGEDSLCQMRDILENLLHKPIIDSLGKTAALLEKATKAQAARLATRRFLRDARKRSQHLKYNNPHQNK